ncbi:MAG: response regulator transcription factor [Anaerolineales bacterium]|nr:response regulator transcription factor [Anaerolineales bacterium]
MLILVADKRSQTRFALRLLIEQATGHTIVAEVADAESLTSKIRETLPDLVLLEWELSHENNGRTISSLKEDHPQMKVLVLSGQPKWRQAALDAGADDFVSKVDPPDRLMMMLNSYK